MTITGGEIAEIILALATFLTALGGVLVSLRNTRKIREVHDLANSLSDKARQQAHALGMEEGRKQLAKELEEARAVAQLVKEPLK